MADASTCSDFAKIPSWQCSDMLAIADIGFFANMVYTRVQRKILEIRLSDFGLHAYKKSVWIPAFAGMTVAGSKRLHSK